MKSYRNEELKFYIIANLIIIYYFSGAYSSFGPNITFEQTLSFIKDIAIITIIYVYIIIIDSLIPSKVKEFFVYFPISKPGFVIFDNIFEGKIGDRIETSKAKKKYNSIYNDLNKIKDQKEKYRVSNSRWYCIYLKYDKEERVYNTQRDFLMLRDMCSHSIVILGCYLLASLIIGKNHICLITLILIVEIIFTKLAAFNKSKRFVETVIAIDVNKNSN